MTTFKNAFLFFIHSLLLQKAGCYKSTKWQLWYLQDITFETPMLTMESVPLMTCLLRCEEIVGCFSVFVNTGSASCELSTHDPPHGRVRPTRRTGWTIYYKVRVQKKTLSVDNGGIWGEWGHSEFCPPGTFAAGFNMKIALVVVPEDQTSLNTLRLICTDEGGIANIPIASTEGPFGNWTPEVARCTIGTYLVNFQLQVQQLGAEKKTGVDNTCANYVKFHCRDLAGSTNEAELVLPPGEGFWGSWGNWSETCGPNSAICGLSTKVEGDQGEGFGEQGSKDDTALNDVVFYCCDDIY